ncbi:hypothetical protein LINPERPRIM_LOCUS8431 [Linum perenne]
MVLEVATIRRLTTREIATSPLRTLMRKR